jgi:cytochrome P450
LPERLFDPDVVQCPFPHYRDLQATCPVYKVPDEDLYLVTTYDDCVEILSDTDTFSSKAGPGLRQKQYPAARAVLDSGHKIVRTLLTNDPPEHSYYRKLVSKAFTARRIAALESGVTVVIDRLVERFAADGGGDFVSAFAQPLPLIVISQFLGVPEEDLDRFKRWSDDAAEVLGGTLSEQEQIRVNRSLVELLQYFADQSATRHESPSADFLSTLVQAENGALSVEEIIAIAYVVLVAGNETTVNLLSSVMLMLLQDSALMARVRADRALVSVVIEEALRLQSPIQGFPRRVLSDTKVGGVAVPAGSQVMVMVAAANRDPAYFEDPEAVRVEEGQPRAHIAFGKGVHFCVGAALSRLEAEIGLNALLDRFSSLSLRDADFAPRYADNAILRSLLELPVVAS